MYHPNSPYIHAANDLNSQPKGGISQPLLPQTNGPQITVPTQAIGPRTVGPTYSYALPSKRKEKDPDHYDGKNVEWPDYICHFEQVALWNKWNDNEKAAQLSISLRGIAQRVLSELTAADLANYNQLKSALSQRFYPPEREAAYRCEFRSKKRRREESAADYGYNLRRLANRAFPKIPMNMREGLIIEQYISGLGNPELKRHVQFSHPTTLDKAISLAVEFEAFEGSQNVFRKPKDDETAQIRAVTDVGSPGQSYMDSRGQEMSQLADSLKDIEKCLKMVVESQTKSNNSGSYKNVNSSFKNKRKIQC